MTAFYKTTLAIFIFACLLSSCDFSPGSYSDAKVYEFEINEDELISIIKQVKTDNPTINLQEKVKVPGGEATELLDGRTDHWYSFYFFYPEKNQIVKTWTRSTFDGTSKFAFIGINEGLTLGNWINPNKESIE